MRLNLIAYGIISQLLEKWSDIKLMILRSWQQKIIDEYPSIIKQNKRFILKAPTGAGKTILASEIVERFYKEKKNISSVSSISSFRAAWACVK